MLVENNVVIITGAASPRGIGKATAKAFAAQAPPWSSWICALRTRRPQPANWAIGTSGWHAM